MKAVKVIYGQAIIDLALQELGDPSRVYEIATLNGLSVTDDLKAGDMILVPDYDADKRTIVQTFALNGNQPASNEVLTFETLEGIDYWALETKFVISQN